MNFIFNSFVIEIFTKFYKTLYGKFCNMTKFEYGQPVLQSLRVNMPVEEQGIFIFPFGLTKKWPNQLSVLNIIFKLSLVGL